MAGRWPAAGHELERARASDDPVRQTAAALVDAAVDCYRAGYTQLPGSSPAW